MSHVPIPVSPAPGRNLRQCPALGGYIKPGDCGAHRGSRIQCPDACVHFPLGTANPEGCARLLETTLDKLGRFLVADLGEGAFQELCAASRYDDADDDVDDDADADEEDEDEALESLESGVDHAIFLCATGRAAGPAAGAMARWAALDWKGLNNDERQMLPFVTQARVALLEVQRTHRSGELWCQELLDPAAGAVLLRDPRLVATTPRFSRLLTWLVPLRHQSLTAGVGIQIRHEAWAPWRDAMLRGLEQARGTSPGLTWTEHITRALPEAVRLEVRLWQDWFDRSRAEQRQGHWFAEWAIVGSAEELADDMAAQEDEFEELEPERVPGAAEAPLASFEWIGGEEGFDDLDGDVVALAEVHVLPQSVVVETESEERHTLCLQRMSQLFGDRVGLLEERHGLSGADDDGDEASDERAFLDEPHPELDQQTPRAAARDPALRPRLLELVKRHLHALDSDRLAGRPVGDYAWLLDELGMAELR